MCTIQGQKVEGVRFNATVKALVPHSPYTNNWINQMELISAYRLIKEHNLTLNSAIFEPHSLGADFGGVQ